MKYRFLGGVKHGQLLDVPDGQRTVKFAVLKKPALLASDFVLVTDTVDDLTYDIVRYEGHSLGLPNTRREIRVFVPAGCHEYEAEHYIADFLEGK